MDLIGRYIIDSPRLRLEDFHALDANHTVFPNITFTSGEVKEPKRNIPLATMIGLGLAAVVYVLSSTVIMGIIPNAELQKSHAPFAEAARIAFGTPVW